MRIFVNASPSADGDAQRDGATAERDRPRRAPPREQAAPVGAGAGRRGSVACACRERDAAGASSSSSLAHAHYRDEDAYRTQSRSLKRAKKSKIGGEERDERRVARRRRRRRAARRAGGRFARGVRCRDASALLAANVKARRAAASGGGQSATTTLTPNGKKEKAGKHGESVKMQDRRSRSPLADPKPDPMELARGSPSRRRGYVPRARRRRDAASALVDGHARGLRGRARVAVRGAGHARRCAGEGGDPERQDGGAARGCGSRGRAAAPRRSRCCSSSDWREFTPSPSRTSRAAWATCIAALPKASEASSLRRMPRPRRLLEQEERRRRRTTMSRTTRRLEMTTEPMDVLVDVLLSSPRAAVRAACATSSSTSFKSVIAVRLRRRASRDMLRVVLAPDADSRNAARGDDAESDDERASRGRRRRGGGGGVGRGRRDGRRRGGWTATLIPTTIRRRRRRLGLGIRRRFRSG